MAKQKEHILFCFISLPALAHGQIVSQLPTVLVPSTSPHKGQEFSGGPDPHERSVRCRSSPNTVSGTTPRHGFLCVCAPRRWQCWPFSTDAWEKFLPMCIHMSLSPVTFICHLLAYLVSLLDPSEVVHNILIILDKSQ